jgi:hypothetical protein
MTGAGHFTQESKVKALNLKDNFMTQESLRHIQLLLELNDQIVVEITEPNRFNWNHHMYDAPPGKIPKSRVRPYDSSDPHASHRGLLEDLSDSESVQEPVGPETQLEREDREARERAKRCRKNCLSKCRLFSSRVCCFRDYNTEYDAQR